MTTKKNQIYINFALRCGTTTKISQKKRIRQIEFLSSGKIFHRPKIIFFSTGLFCLIH